MNEYMKGLFNSVIAELSEKVIEDPQDNTYNLILKQIEFLQDCLVSGKDINSELNGRELNFNVVASKSLSGPEVELQEKIGEISVYLCNEHNI